METTTVTAKTKLLNAALKLIRVKGYGATTVDDLCREAGVTKGAFFHHFSSKEALGVAATQHWSEVTDKIFEQAPYHRPKKAVDRVLAYIDFRAAMLEGRSVPEFTCLLGTMVQETHFTSDVLREACDLGISGHAATLARDIEEAMAARRVTGFTAQSLALYMQASLQGAFILAKAKGGAEVARDSIAHLKRYVELLFKATH
jgi:TetR/AcrR family transcriptional regulator, transcriptional repressor for nem operon